LKKRGVGLRRATSALLAAALLASLAIAPSDAAPPAARQQEKLVVGAILDLATVGRRLVARAA
jgi:hypothetical protein